MLTTHFLHNAGSAPGNEGNAIETAYHDVGAGAPFVLVHGFTGSKTELKSINQAYKVDFLAQEPNLRGEYDVMHSNRVFGFDADGRCRVLMPNTANTDAMVADLRQLLDL